MRLLLSSALLLVGFVSACGGDAKRPPESAPVETASSGRPSLDPAKVVFAMRGAEKDYRKCFFQAPGSRGSVQTAFEVGSNGAVERASVERATLDRPEVTDCLLRRLRDQRFGELSQASSGSWTFVFRLVDPIEPKEFERRIAAEEEKDPEPGIQLDASSSGSLTVEQIEETVHARYPLFARCYRDSIRRREDAGGVIRFRIVIAEDGRVRELDDAGSIMPDPFAVDCIAEGFYAMSFPHPSGGPVTATYRLELD